MKGDLIWCVDVVFGRVGPMIGLLLIGFGTGGIKPCVSAFGGDQFSSNQVYLMVSPSFALISSSLAMTLPIHLSYCGIND